MKCKKCMTAMDIVYKERVASDLAKTGGAVRYSCGSATETTYECGKCGNVITKREE